MKNLNLLKKTLVAPLLAFALTVALGPEAGAQNDAKNKVFAFVEEMPQFKNGEAAMLQFLGTNIKYPVTAVSNGLEGLVVISFVVETDGRLTDINTVKSLSKETDEEALRVAKLMNGQ